MMRNMQVFEPFGTVELVQLPTDLETGHCKGFGFVQVSMMLTCYALGSGPRRLLYCFLSGNPIKIVGLCK